MLTRKVLAPGVRDMEVTKHYVALTFLGLLNVLVRAETQPQWAVTG
jgi:hypothetical protein